MTAEFRARYTIDRYFKRGMFLINYDQLWEILTNHLSLAGQQLSVNQFLERPFSVILNLKAASDDRQSYFVKLYKIVDLQKQRLNIKKEFSISRHWFEKFKADAHFQVIEPVWLDEQNLIIVTRKSPGINLLKLTDQLRFFPSRTSVRQVLDFLFRAGQWLNKFQSFPIDEKVPYLEEAVHLTLDYLQNYLLIRMQKMVKNPHLDFDQQLQEKILAFLQNQWQQADQDCKRLTFTHTDFSLSNVLVSQQKITVLDFGKCEINSPYKDLARFYHQLYLLGFKPSFQNNNVRKMQTAFLQGYGDPQADKCPLFKIFFMIHQVTHLGKISRFWERGPVENFYNRFLVKRVLKDLKATVL